MDTITVRAAAAPFKGKLPFAALPHDIASDPRLSPVDVRVLLALLFWARSATSCWPSDPKIAARIGRSVSTVRRSLRKLALLGLVRREKDDGEGNRTGRLIVLTWRALEVAEAVPPPRLAARTSAIHDRPPGHPRPEPRPPMTDPPASPVIDEGRSEGERERPASDAGREGPPPPADESGGEAPATPAELARFRAWADGRDPVLARFGRAALKLAGIDPDAGDLPGPPTVDGDASAPPEAPSHVPAAADTPRGPAATPARTGPSTPTRGRPGPRHVLERAVLEDRPAVPLPVWMVPGQKS
jgi:DNA-binding MarR family transcriptional regulator